MELMITVTLVGVLVFIGATSLRVDETKETRGAAFDVVGLFRTARFVAARQNRAVVVTVLPFGTITGTGVTSGYAEARLAVGAECPSWGVAPGTGLIAYVDFNDAAPWTDIDNQLTHPCEAGSPCAGIARVTPADLVTERFCVRPSGRIVNDTTTQPILGSGLNLAGKAQIWIQHDPVREVAGQLSVPFFEIEVPYNGLVRIPQ